MRKLFSVIAAVAMISTNAIAADLGGGGQCVLVHPSSLLSIESNADLTDEVVRLMTDAVNVADSEEWITSDRPAFVWASEAKVACGKAYGYLQSDYRDEDTLNKCECFHQRMRQYMY